MVPARKRGVVQNMQRAEVLAPYCLLKRKRGEGACVFLSIRGVDNHIGANPTCVAPHVLIRVLFFGFGNLDVNK